VIDLWQPSYGREGLFWQVWKRKWSDAFGSAYNVAKNKHGERKRFWTKQGAQDYADALNFRDQKWRPISEAEPCKAYVLWCSENGLCVGFCYDTQWVALVGDQRTVISPTHFRPAPDSPEYET